MEMTDKGHQGGKWQIAALPFAHCKRYIAVQFYDVFRGIDRILYTGSL